MRAVAKCADNEGVDLMKRKKNIKIIFIVLFILLISSCSKNVTIDISENKKALPNEEIYKGEGIRRWEDIGQSFENSCVTNEETAVKIADAITAELQSQGCFKGIFPDDSIMYAISSFYDIEDRTWIITYGSYETDTSGEKVPVPGTDFCLAISEDDGRILRMWFFG